MAKKSEFKMCETAKDIISFFQDKERAFRHTNYYHYTTLQSINSILESKTLWLSPLSRSANDVAERERYKKLGENIFSVCFSTGTSESLPLWYLYSGIDGGGARLELKKKSFEKLIKNGVDISLAEMEPNNKIKIKNRLKLEKEDYKLYTQDIVYIGKDSQNKDKYRIKYNNETKNDVSQKCVEQIKEEYQRFTKGLIWFYEKETRLQVEITNTELLDENKEYRVILSLEKVYEDIALRLAPEFDKVETKLINQYAGIRKFVSSKIQKSEYAGEMEMGLKDKLCKECWKVKRKRLKAISCYKIIRREKLG